MFVDVALEVVVNLCFQYSRAGIAEYADGNLPVVLVRTLDIDKDFHVTRFAVSGHNARNLQIRRCFARSFSGDLRDRSNGKSVFNHDSDLYMRSDGPEISSRKNLRGCYFPRC